jgi:hypothetical protein
VHKLRRSKPLEQAGQAGAAAQPSGGRFKRGPFMSRISEIGAPKAFTMKRSLAAKRIGCSIDTLYHWEQNDCCPYVDPNGEEFVSQSGLFDERDINHIAAAFKAAKEFVASPPEVLDESAFDTPWWKWPSKTSKGIDYYSTEKARKYLDAKVVNVHECIDSKFIRCISAFGRTFRYFGKAGLDQWKKNRPRSRPSDQDRVFLEEVMTRAHCTINVIRAVRKKYRYRLTVEKEEVLWPEESAAKEKTRHRITLSRRELFGPEDEAAAAAMKKKATDGELRLPIFVDKPRKGECITLIGHEEEYFFQEDACARFHCSPGFLYRHSKKDTIKKRGGKAIRPHMFFLIGDRSSAAHKGKPAYRGDDIQAIIDGEEEVHPKVASTLFSREQRKALGENVRAFLNKLRPLLPIRANDGIRLAEKHGFRANMNPRPVDANAPPAGWTYNIFRDVFKQLGFQTTYQFGTKPPPRWWCDSGQKVPSPTSADEIVRRYQQSDLYRELAAPRTASTDGQPEQKSQRNQQPDRAAPTPANGSVPAPKKNKRGAPKKSKTTEVQGYIYERWIKGDPVEDIWRGACEKFPQSKGYSPPSDWSNITRDAKRFAEKFGKSVDRKKAEKP